MKLREHMKIRSRELRRKLTPAEIRLWNRLRGKQLDGLRFLRQHPIGPYVADFYCAETRLVIELDGGQHDRPDVAGYDRLRSEELESRRLRVLRFKNDEVMANIETVLDRIRQVSKESNSDE